METTAPKLDAMAYLLGGVGLLAILPLPLSALFMSEVQPVGKLVLGAYWLLGALLVGWAARRFSKLGERVVALIAIVIGWYVVLQVLMMLETMVFRF